MKVSPSVLVGQFSGKAGSAVGVIGKAGQQVRARKKPTNPKTAAQIFVRGNLTTNAKAWSDLSQSEIAGWNSVAATLSAKGYFGNSRVRTGFNFYLEVNNNLLLLGLSPITTAPAIPSIEAIKITAITASAGADTITVTFSPTVPANTKYLVWATPAVSPGRTNINNELRFIGALNAAATSPGSLTTMYIAKYGSVGTEGKKIGVRLIPFDVTSGIQGAPVYIEALIAA